MPPVDRIAQVAERKAAGEAKPWRRLNDAAALIIHPEGMF